MDWDYYKSLLKQKVEDAEHNYKYADKKAKEAKAVLESALKEKEVFEQNLVRGED